jgi:hypothetical protein
MMTDDNQPTAPIPADLRELHGIAKSYQEIRMKPSVLVSIIECVGRAEAPLTPEEIATLGNMLSVMKDGGMYNLPQLQAIADAVNRLLAARAARPATENGAVDVSGC